ncbi:hypothetical protein ACQSED_23965 [Salmonella enterica]|uniref:hypothetical protein n=1 Tax=Salmonella enterica TaxID=28901 RepID=UPI000426A66B
MNAILGKNSERGHQDSLPFCTGGLRTFPDFFLYALRHAPSPFCQDASIPNPAYKQKTAGDPAAVAHNAF